MKKILVILCVALSWSYASGQRSNIGFVYPAGGQRGTTFEVTVGGQNLDKATGVVVSGGGVTAELIPMDKAALAQKRKSKAKAKKDIGEEDNLQLADRRMVRITITPDAPLGLRDFRFTTSNGYSNRLFFEVGQLPNVLEKEPNQEAGTPALSLPATLNGQAMRSDVDRFRFRAAKGQQLLLRARGRAFVPYMADAVPGWFQPVMRVYDARMNEVAFNDDYRHEVDPVILFDVPADGEYTVEIHDALFRGREDFVYRIDVGELPFITSVFPLGGNVSKKTRVALRGINLPDGNMTVTSKRSDPHRTELQVTGAGGYVSNAVPFDLDNQNERTIDPRKPNFSKKDAMPVKLGDVVNGVIAEPFQTHWYVIRCEERTPVAFEVLGRRLGSPVDMRLTLFTPSGKAVGEEDDTKDPEEYLMTHFADPVMVKNLWKGTHLLRVAEAQGHGGPEYAYRLKIGAPSPDFVLNVEPSTLTIPAGGSGALNIVSARKQNFKGDISVYIDGLPEGYKTSYNVMGPASPRMTMTITAPAGDTVARKLSPVVYGVAHDDKGREVRREAKPAEGMLQAFYISHLLPIDDLDMRTAPAQPFTLSVDAGGEPIVLSREEPIPVKVRIHRAEGFDEAMSIMIRTADRSVKAEPVVVAGHESECTLHLTFKSNRQQEAIVPVAVSGIVKPSSVRGGGKNTPAAAGAGVTRVGKYTVSSSITAYSPAFTVSTPASPKPKK